MFVRINLKHRIFRNQRHVDGEIKGFSHTLASQNDNGDDGSLKTVYQCLN